VFKRARKASCGWHVFADAAWREYRINKVRDGEMDATGGWMRRRRSGSVRVRVGCV
jgi:hypothetical protein